MERSDLIFNIVDAERRAKLITNEAIAKRKGLDEEIEQAVRSMRDNYMERAEARIEKVRRTENDAAREQIEMLDERRKSALSRIDSSFEKNGEAWVDTIFSHVIGRTQL